jgi:hypothetical protein
MQGTCILPNRGFSYGDPAAPARVLQVTPDGSSMTYVAEQLNGPVTGQSPH